MILRLRRVFRMVIWGRYERLGQDRRAHQLGGRSLVQLVMIC